MVHPWPREVALSYCTHCGIVGLAEHVNQEDQIPRRFCCRCGKALEEAVYRRDRDLGLTIKVKSRKRRRRGSVDP
jgi:hypothetical protein